ncbi:hypothetical protein B9J75_05890 [Leuconostoc citreum]|nr:hypothetical protein B9J75_05890 [Leuconostoc citreum]
MTLRGGKMENKKEHYKLYKSGKIWVTASIVAAVMGATTVSVSASTDNTVADKQSIESSPKSKTLDKSVSSADLDQSIKDAKKANVDVRENSKASNITQVFKGLTLLIVVYNYNLPKIQILKIIKSKLVI